MLLYTYVYILKVKVLHTKLLKFENNKVILDYTYKTKLFHNKIYII